jgi:hypothetical protein
MSCVDLQNKYNELVSKQELIQRQMDAQNQITSLLEKSAEAISCGPECQKQKISDELKQKYLDAETNLKTAPINLETTRKNYYVYTEGQPYYDNMLEAELKQKAEKIAGLITESFNEEVASALTMNQYYNTDIINCRYTEELLANIIKQNKSLSLKLRNSHGDILTNDRKTYYENTASERLQLWYKFLWYIYYILVIVFLIGIFLVPSKVSLIIKIVILVLLIFYPYYVDYIWSWLYNTILNMYTQLPKNVYNNL